MALDNLENKKPDLVPQGPKENQDSGAFNAGTKMQLQPMGVSGTEIYAGYFREEYLQLLTGRRGAKVWDEMRRSEAQISMLMNAIMNPIKAATWETEAALVPDGEVHKAFIEYNLKDMIDWETFIHEALTMIVQGYSLFEVIYCVVFNNEKFGTFNGLKGLAFRSQKTVEKWNVDSSTGDLQSVTQWIQGDLAKGRANSMVDILADFLLVLTLQKEGDNYAGISALRPMYGAYFRKNLYLKIMAIGIEKNAIGTPLGTIPAGKQSQEQIEKFEEVLSNFTAHEAAYLTKPEGWEIEILKSDFDPSKLKDAILMENTEMINSVVANFLALGTNGGSGSFALGSDLSDFFLSGIQIYANIISGVLNRKLIPQLIKLNFGPQAAYPKIKATGINDKAGKELAEILKSLIDSKALTADDKLEEFLRKQYSLPKQDPLTARKSDTPKPFQFAERHMKLSESYKKKWKAGKDEVKEVMQTGLTTMLEDLKNQISRKYKSASDAAKVSLATELVPKTSVYEASLREVFAEIANDALISAKKETPKAKNVKLAETFKLAAPAGGFFDALPTNIKRLVRAQAKLVSESQAADLNKVVTFQYTSSQTGTQDVDQILIDIDDKALPVIEGSTKTGMSVETAAGNAVSTVVNQARMEWFFEPEVLDTIESFTFYNEDPQSEICQELNGQTWAVNDPDVDKYGPPLHHLCKSRLLPNDKGADGNPEINRKGTPVTQKGLDSITLCEEHYGLNFQLGGPGSGPQGGAGGKSQGSSKSKTLEPSKDEAKAIRFYTGSASSAFIDADKTGTGTMVKENEQLNNFLSNAPKYSGDIHRGISVEKKDAKGILEKYKPGSEVSLDAKQSWTTDTKNVQARLTQVANSQKNPTPIVFEYPNSKVGVDISKHSRMEEEKEVLVPKGTKYKVKSVAPHNGGYKITFE